VRSVCDKKEGSVFSEKKQSVRRFCKKQDDFVSAEKIQFGIIINGRVLRIFCTTWSENMSRNLIS
jgi:hypothetical protein